MKEQKRVPKLRFAKFIEEWRLYKLHEVATIITGTTPSTFNSDYYENGNFHFVSPADINGNRFITKTRTCLTELGLSKTRKIGKGSVLFVCIGSTIGKVAQTTEVSATNQQINALESKVGHSEGFLFSLLENKSGRIRLLAGNQAVPQLNKSDFSAFKFHFPELEEQQKIASFLSSVDRKISLLQQKKGLLEDYKKGAMQQIFSQELRFTKENGSEYPDWEEKQVGEILKIGSGKDYKHLQTGVIPVYGTGGLMTFVNDFLYDGQSVGIGRKGTIDKPVFLEGKFWTVDTLFYTHSFKMVLPKFIFYIFLSIKWKKYNEASGVPSLSKATIEKIYLSIPSIEEQTKIIEFLSTIDEKIDIVQKQIEQTQTFKKGLLQQMFV